MQTLEEQFAYSEHSVVLLTLERHQLYRVTGPDASRYLQGRLTQDVKTLTAGHGARSLLLTPQGRILGKMTILREADDFLVIADPGQGDDPAEHFKRALLQFKVADQLELVPLSGSHTLLSIQGPRSEELLESCSLSTIPRRPLDHTPAQLAGVLIQLVRRRRSSTDGFDLVVPSYAVDNIKSELQTSAKLFSVVPGDEALRQLLRITAGEAEVGSELDEKVLATEIDVTEYISFSKGCYAGQEAVEMSTARGRPNRRLVRLIGTADTAPAPGAPLTEAESEKAVGTIASCVHLAGERKVYGLGFVKTAVDETAPLFCGSLQLEQRSPS